MADPYGPLFMLFHSKKLKQNKSVGVLIVCHFLTSQSWRDKWHVSWFNEFISRLSLETKPHPKSCPTLSIFWRRLKRPNNMALDCQHCAIHFCMFSYFVTVYIQLFSFRAASVLLTQLSVVSCQYIHCCKWSLTPGMHWNASVSGGNTGHWGRLWAKQTLARQPMCVCPLMVASKKSVFDRLSSASRGVSSAVHSRPLIAAYVDSWARPSWRRAQLSGFAVCRSVNGRITLSVGRSVSLCVYAKFFSYSAVPHVT